MEFIRNIQKNSIIILLLILFTSCDDNISNSPENATPGELKLIWLKGLRKTNKGIHTKEYYRFEDTEFDLGEIQESQDFYFSIVNIGGETIKDIFLSMPDSLFKVHPQQIDSLMPEDNYRINDISTLPIIRITAIHGTVMGGNGFTDFMEPGLNTGTLYVEGKTLDEAREESSITLTAKMNVYALLMDVVVFDGLEELNLSDGYGFILEGGFVINDFVRNYRVSDTVRIENTGSTPIKIRIFKPNDIVDTLKIGESIKLEFGISTHVSFDGALANPVRLPSYSDGKTYIHLNY